jgi:hypothetical protein
MKRRVLTVFSPSPSSCRGVHEEPEMAKQAHLSPFQFEMGSERAFWRSEVPIQGARRRLWPKSPSSAASLAARTHALAAGRAATVVFRPECRATGICRKRVD